MHNGVSHLPTGRGIAKNTAMSSNNTKCSFFQKSKRLDWKPEDVYLKTGLKILGSCNRVPEIPKLFTRLSMIKSA
jgi:hypothetical protein